MTIPAPIQHKLRSYQSSKELAFELNVTARTIRNWRKRCGITGREKGRSPVIDYSRIDAALTAGKSVAEVVADLGEPEQRVRRRWGHLKRSGAIVNANPPQRQKWQDDDEQAVPMIDIRERLKLALEAKAERIGRPIAWIKQTWLHGPAGRDFLGEYQGIGGGVYV